jgi:outer membrane receptor protein involved in Fe transport
MEDAAREIGNVQLGWRPAFAKGADVSLEWQRIGKYWMDADNTHRYPGHDLFHVRASAPLAGGVSVFGRLANLTDERYAESAAYNAFRGEELAPGLPRTVYLGLQFR